MITIGVDPHKESHTAHAIDEREVPMGRLRVVANRGQVERLLAWASQFPQRRWGVEGANGIGRLLAQQLVAAGEEVVDVPATLAARVRTLGSGRTDKNDDHDAAAVAVVALRHSTLRLVVAEDHTALLHLLSERRGQLVSARIQTVGRLHALLRCLVPGGAKRFLSSRQAAIVLRALRPVTVIDAERKAVARELLEELRAIETRIKSIELRIKEAVVLTDTSLLEIPGISYVLAAKILGHVGNPGRFPTRGHFAAYCGVAPVEASSGPHVRHRLNRRGNRQLNYALHLVAVSQRSHRSIGRDYFERKLADGKSPAEARRALKRQIANAVYRALQDDARRETEAAQGGHRGTTLHQRDRLTPATPALRASHNPGPAPTLRPRH